MRLPEASRLPASDCRSFGCTFQRETLTETARQNHLRMNRQLGSRREIDKLLHQVGVRRRRDIRTALDTEPYGPRSTEPSPRAWPRGRLHGRFGARVRVTIRYKESQFQLPPEGRKASSSGGSMQLRRATSDSFVGYGPAHKEVSKERIRNRSSGTCLPQHRDPWHPTGGVGSAGLRSGISPLRILLTYGALVRL